MYVYKICGLMSGDQDIDVTRSDEYITVNVAGQLCKVGYDGMKLTVWEETDDFTNALKGTTFHASKIIINRKIKCTLNLTPSGMKTWALLLQHELRKYEKKFGPILSPEEVAQKMKQEKKGE